MRAIQLYLRATRALNCEKNESTRPVTDQSLPFGTMLERSKMLVL